VKRLSVAVLVDQTLTPAQQTALRKALSAAAGLDVNPPSKGGRGDLIELSPMPFDKSTAVEVTKAADTAAKQSLRSEMVKNGSAVVIVILVLLGSLFVGKKLLSPTRPRLDAIAGETLSPLGMSGAREEMHATYSAPGSSRAASVTDQVRNRATERPDDVARQLQSWLTE
jgi:flagellar M-ring protein FliF